MLALIIVVTQFVLLAAFALGIVAFVGLIVYDALAGRTAPERRDEQTAYAPVPARAA